jgi:hypothetical protein
MILLTKKDIWAYLRSAEEIRQPMFDYAKQHEQDHYFEKVISHFSPLAGKETVTSDLRRTTLTNMSFPLHVRMMAVLCVTSNC